MAASASLSFDFQRDHSQGYTEWLQRLRSRINVTPAPDVESVFRYWTTFVIINYLKTERKFVFSKVTEEAALFFCEIEKPFRTCLLLAIDANAPAPSIPKKSTDQTAQELLTFQPIFTYRILIQHYRTQQLLACDSHPFSADSETVLEIGHKIVSLYHQLHYEVIVDTSSLFAVQGKTHSVISTGPVETPQQRNYIEPQFISWRSVANQLLRNLIFLKTPVTVLSSFTFPEELRSALSSAYPSVSRAWISLQLEKTEHKQIGSEDFQNWLDESVAPRHRSHPGLLSALEHFFQIRPSQLLWFKMVEILQRVLESASGYVILILPPDWKILVDAALPLLFQTDVVQVLLPNTQRYAYSIAVPFFLDRVPWLPHLFQYEPQWYNLPQTLSLIQEQLQEAKIPSSYEPLFTANFQQLYLWDPIKKHAIYRLQVTSTTTDTYELTATQLT